MRHISGCSAALCAGRIGCSERSLMTREVLADIASLLLMLLTITLVGAVAWLLCV